MSSETTTGQVSANGAIGAETLSVTDNRTGKTYEIPIADGTIRATELRNIQVDDEDFGLMSYDPAFMNTASCRSSITFLDGERGILELLDVYRAGSSARVRQAALDLATREAEIELEFVSGWEIP